MPPHSNSHIPERIVWLPEFRKWRLFQILFEATGRHARTQGAGVGKVWQAGQP